MASEMIEALIQLCQDKHIDELYLLDRLEQSLAESYAKLLKLDWGAKVTIDRATGNIYVYKLEPVDESMDEEGNYTEFNEIDVTPKDTSRAAARAAKDEISAIVRNAARQEIYEEFSHRGNRAAVNARFHDCEDSRGSRSRVTALRPQALPRRA